MIEKVHLMETQKWNSEPNAGDRGVQEEQRKERQKKWSISSSFLKICWGSSVEHQQFGKIAHSFWFPFPLCYFFHIVFGGRSEFISGVKLIKLLFFLPVWEYFWDLWLMYSISFCLCDFGFINLVIEIGELSHFLFLCGIFLGEKGFFIRPFLGTKAFTRKRNKKKEENRKKNRVMPRKKHRGMDEKILKKEVSQSQRDWVKGRNVHWRVEREWLLFSNHRDKVMWGNNIQNGDKRKYSWRQKRLTQFWCVSSLIVWSINYVGICLKEMWK